jgi:hypothetical protein
VGRLLPLPQPLAVGPNRRPRRAKFTHSKFKRATIIDNVFPDDNEFVVTAGQITAASYHAGPFSDTPTAIYTLDLEGPGVDAILFNYVQDQAIIGPVEYTPVTTPEPSSLAVLGTLAGLFLLKFSRAKRRDRHIRPHPLETA